MNNHWILISDRRGYESYSYPQPDMLIKNAVRLAFNKNVLRHSSTFPSYGLEKKWAHYNQLAITAEAEKVCFL